MRESPKTVSTVPQNLEALVWLSAFCFALATKNSHWSSIAAILVASLNTGEIQKHITGRSFTNFKDSVPNFASMYLRHLSSTVLIRQLCNSEQWSSESRRFNQLPSVSHFRMRADQYHMLRVTRTGAGRIITTCSKLLLWKLEVNAVFTMTRGYATRPTP